MTTCCEHPESEHQLVSTCQEVIHYPSEDYPCLCHGYEPGEGEACTDCGHRRASHIRARVCKPASGAFCPCRQSQGMA